MQNGNDLYGVA